jgi:hypothetical protein
MLCRCNAGRLHSVHGSSMHDVPGPTPVKDASSDPVGRVGGLVGIQEVQDSGQAAEPLSLCTHHEEADRMADKEANKRVVVVELQRIGTWDTRREEERLSNGACSVPFGRDIR